MSSHNHSPSYLIMPSPISRTSSSLIALCLNIDYKLSIIEFAKHYAYLGSYLNNLKLSCKAKGRAKPCPLTHTGLPGEHGKPQGPKPHNI